MLRVPAGKLTCCVELENIAGEIKAEGIGAQKRAQSITAARIVFFPLSVVCSRPGAP